jgi:hypothetical protein
MISFCTLAKTRHESRFVCGIGYAALLNEAGVSSGCISSRSADVKEWIHIDNCCRFGLPTSWVVGHTAVIERDSNELVMRSRHLVRKSSTDEMRVRTDPIRN